MDEADESRSVPVVVHYNRDVELNADVLNDENDKADDFEEEEVVMESGFVSGGAFDSFDDGFEDWATPGDIPDRVLFGEIEDIVDD